MNLPTIFTDYTRKLLGIDEYERLVAALLQAPPVSIRLNKYSSFVPHSSLQRVLWAEQGYYLAERPSFTFDPLFHAGCYYVQEASSMFTEQVMRRYVAEPVVMLDLCAAPGGKSTHARNLLPEGSLLVANEVIRSRSQVLAENLTKCGHPDVVVANNDPADFRALPSFFDVVLTDVPCSGEGMFRKDPTAVDEWSAENVEICWQRQRRIVSDVWPSLKPGGLLIYSTCTYNTKENEENVRWICRELGAEALQVDVPTEWNITGNLLSGDDSAVYRFFPHKTRGEGFFLAVLRKQEIAETHSWSAKTVGRKEREAATKQNLVSKQVLTTAQTWLNTENADKYVLLTEGATIQAFPKLFANELTTLKRHLKMVQAGVAVCEVKGKDLIPAHALAMCPTLLRKDTFHTTEVSYEQAIAYLRKEAIPLPPSTPRGFVLLTYQTVPLGFVKNIGNRANNLYPQEWRIRKT